MARDAAEVANILDKSAIAVISHLTADRAKDLALNCHYNAVGVSLVEL